MRVATAQLPSTARHAMLVTDVFVTFDAVACDVWRVTCGLFQATIERVWPGTGTAFARGVGF